LNEAWALEDFLGSSLNTLGGLAATVEGDRLLQCILTTILIVSRCDRHWTLDQSLGLPDDQIQAAAEFFLGERRRWRDENDETREPDEPQQNASEFDWGLLYRRLQLAYPNDPDFSKAGFANCPIVRIEQSLEAHQQVELERNYRESQAIALVGAYLLSAKGMKDAKTELFNPFERTLNVREAKRSIDGAAARLFLELVTDGKVPGWTVAIVDVGVVRLAAG